MADDARLAPLSSPPPPAPLSSRRADDLGVRRALGAGMLPVLVAAMAFLAALALAGSVAASALARHWREGAAAALTVQVPDPADPLSKGGDAAPETRLDRALTVLRDTPGVDSVHALSGAELAELLRPWLGNMGADPTAGGAALPLPAVVRARVDGDAAGMAELRTRMQAEVPGALVESHGAWVARLVVLARGVQVAAWLLLAVVAGVAAAVVTVATGAGLAARRESIEIIHGLGATDGYIAGRFARRAMLLAALGALAGAVVALPVLFAFARLATPFITAATGSAAAAAVASPDPVQWLMALPTELLIGLPALPVVAALLGLATAHLTVRLWLRRLP